MFNQANTLKQGALGLARAVYEYQKLGYTVSIPLVDAQDYDLVIEKDGKFYSVQCKTTSVHPKFKSGLPKVDRYFVSLTSIKTNTKKTTITKRGNYDILFVLCSDDSIYSIPANELPMSCAVVGGKNKYDKYKIG